MDSKTVRRRKRKSELVSCYGGECACCGYKYDGSNACVFDFHHEEHQKKSFLFPWLR